jgi:hypothetical protein
VGSGGANAGGTTTNGGSSGSGGASSKPDAATGSGGSAAGGATVSSGGSGSGGAKTGGAGGGTTGSGTGGSTGTNPSGGTAGGGATGAGGAAGSGCPAVDEIANATWATGKSPTEIGKAAVENFKPRTSETYGGDGYAWTFGYVGSLLFTQTIGDKTNNDFLISKFSCTQAGPDNTSSATVDTRAFGDLPLEIFLENGSTSCKTLGLARADAQAKSKGSDGLPTDVRYWIDDMYMITSLQVWAFRATKEQSYLDLAAKTMQAYFTALQQKDGLFWHTKQSKAYWGRANGWVASGMTELLLELPAGTARDAVMAGYKKQMDGLLPLQIASGTDAGAWRQVLDRSDAKPEMSCTAMFTFALTTGVKNGWLTDAKYATAAVNGWKAVANRTSSSGQLDQVCPGTGQAPSGDLASQQKFYMDIAFQANDRHGQGPELWAANALLRKDCPGVR